MKAIVLTTPYIAADAPKEVWDADVVVHLDVHRVKGDPESRAVARVVVLRSKFGDPFAVSVPLDFAFTDPERVEADAKRMAEEIAAATATLVRHGVLASAPMPDMRPPPDLAPVPPASIPAPAVAYDGTPCSACGALLVVRTGTCKTCQGCGHNDGCS